MVKTRTKSLSDLPQNTHQSYKPIHNHNIKHSTNISKLESTIAQLQDQLDQFTENYEEIESNVDFLLETINNSPTTDNTFSQKAGKQLTLSAYLSQHIPNISPDEHTTLLANTEKFLSSLNINFTEKEYTLVSYFAELDTHKQSQLLSHCETITKQKTISQPPIITVLESTMSPYQKCQILAKLSNMSQLSTEDPEYFKLQQWILTVMQIPFNKYNIPNYISLETIEQKSQYLQNAEKQLDNVIYGQSATKKHIIEILAKLMNQGENSAQYGSNFAIYGEAGTGKTSLIKHGLAPILGLPFVFISLGGATDATTLNGSSYTYIGSTAGSIVNALKSAQCMNPIFYFDELDKVSGTERGAEIINLLIHLTDHTQNGHFKDNYLDGIDLDISRATFVFSFNDIKKVSPILLDRLQLIKFHSYTPKQKIVIARKYLAPTIFMEYLGKYAARYSIKFSTKLLSELVNKNAKVSGVRYLKKKMEKMVAALNVCLIKGEMSSQKWFRIIGDRKIIIEKCC